MQLFSLIEKANIFCEFMQIRGACFTDQSLVSVLRYFYEICTECTVLPFSQLIFYTWLYLYCERPNADENEKYPILKA